MTEHAAFLNAILERPDDDLPRLVYADYLEETGDAERAEFIRVQLELANSEEDAPNRPWLETREEELLKVHGEWRLPIRGIQRFHRGFIESMATTADWLIGAGPVLRLAPVRELRVINADNAIAALAQVPGLERIETLDLRNNSFGTQDRLARFFDAAPLRSLTNLVLGNNQLWSDDVEKLVASRWAPQLRSLDLSGNAIGDAGAGVLALAGSLRNLETLILRSEGLDWRDRIQTDGAEVLGITRNLERLRSLDISGHLIGEAGASFLIDRVGLPALEEIDASHNRIDFADSPDTEDLFEARPRERLRVCTLSGSTVSLRAAAGFAGWTQLETLDRLILERCEWAPGARELLTASQWAYKINLDNPTTGELA